jgi:hypothetical protein
MQRTPAPAERLHHGGGGHLAATTDHASSAEKFCDRIQPNNAMALSGKKWLFERPALVDNHRQRYHPSRGNQAFDQRLRVELGTKRPISAEYAGPLSEEWLERDDDPLAQFSPDRWR